MEKRIFNRVIIAVNKRNKLLGYLRKLNSGDTEGVSVRIVHTPKEKPINLFFTRSGTVDNFLVYADFGKAGSKKKVVLGSATIVSLRKSGFASAGNRESKECVAINVYAKEDSLDSKELQDILLSLIRSSTHDLIITSAAMLIELKPENKNIISYEVSMLPNNPLDSSAAKKAIDSAVNTKPQYVCHSKNSNSTVTESERGTQEVLKRRHNTDSRKSYNIESELVIASSMIKSDLKKPLKKWSKILKTEPIEIITHIDLRAGHILGFYIKKSTYEINNVAIRSEKIYRYELVVKYSLNDCIVNSKSRGITTPGLVLTGFILKALHNAYILYKQRKSENLNISHLESLIKKNKKISNQKEDRGLVSIIAEALREIGDTNKISVNRHPKLDVTEDLFCKKIKVNSKKDSNTIRSYRPYKVPNPVVTILTSDESKDKVKEIIEEANKTNSFPYMLDYDNNCVVRISDNLFDILECRNKLEDILKIRKDIDVGIFALESTEGLVFKKLFNISSLTVYHSASKNLYALIGA